MRFALRLRVSLTFAPTLSEKDSCLFISSTSDTGPAWAPRLFRSIPCSQIGYPEQTCLAVVSKGQDVDTVIFCPTRPPREPGNQSQTPVHLPRRFLADGLRFLDRLHAPQ